MSDVEVAQSMAVDNDALPSGRGTVPTMASSGRLALVSLGYLGSYLLLFIVPLGYLGVAKLVGVNLSSDSFANTIVTLVFLCGALTIGLYTWYYLLWVRLALHVPFGPSRKDLPKIVAPAVIFSGALEYEIQARVKTLLGRAGKCRIELYGDGIKIWRGPGHLAPSWSFLYPELVQAELTTVMGGSRTPDIKFLRLVAGRPLMAFLISSRGQSDELLRRLGKHGVNTFAGD